MFAFFGRLRADNRHRDLITSCARRSQYLRDRGHNFYANE